MAREKSLTIQNKRGLHARASAKFAKVANDFPDTTVFVSRDGHTAPATSIMDLMMLAAGIGSTIDVKASGPQADAALDALERLVNNRFDEDE